MGCSSLIHPLRKRRKQKESSEGVLCVLELGGGGGLTKWDSCTTEGAFGKVRHGRTKIKCC